MKTNNLNIWVVEDDPMYQQTLISYLDVLGYKARAFNNGEECLDFLGQSPDVVLLDHNLGDGMKGTDVLRELKHQYLNTHVIYISGEEKVSLVAETYKNGSEEFISKDSASLLRLKLRLDKIQEMKLLCKKRSKRKKTILVSAFIAFVVELIVYLVMVA